MAINPHESGLNQTPVSILYQRGRPTVTLNELNELVRFTGSHDASFVPFGAIAHLGINLLPRTNRYSLDQAAALLFIAQKTDGPVIVGKVAERRRVNDRKDRKIVSTTRAKTRAVIEKEIDLSENGDGSVKGLDTLYYAITGRGLIYFAGIQH